MTPPSLRGADAGNPAAKEVMEYDFKPGKKKGEFYRESV
jgi:hypothetical protein